MEQQSAGLVAPAAAVTLLGSGGAGAILIATFMAATSAASAEMIAISSVLTYDVLGTYWKPLTGQQAIKWQHGIIGELPGQHGGAELMALAGFALWIGCGFSNILYKAGINLGWLFYFMGVALTPAVTPIALTVCWKKMSHTSTFYGTLVGTICGMLGWFVGCLKIYGKINIDNLALPYSAISGSM